MKEIVELELKLSATFWDKAPHAKVYINDTVIHDGIVDSPITIKHSVELDEGDHTLSVELLGKNNKQTVVDSEGNILKDQLLNIDYVGFDEIDIGYLKHLLSTYHADNGETILRCINLGLNGRWVLPFKAPIYIWLLENL